MDLKISPMEPGERIAIPQPDPRFYQALGEEGFRAFFSRFYDIVAEDDDIAHFFPEEGPELEQAKQNAADFFIQAYGGPKWFDERRGGISMEEAHARFSVTPRAREGWLHCLKIAMDELEGLDDDLKLGFWNYVDQFSKMIVNVSGMRARTYEEMVKV